MSEDSNEFQTLLVVDKTIVCEIPTFGNIPFMLMASFFVFNICYPKGCINLYSLKGNCNIKLPSEWGISNSQAFH